ncbi:sensor histidine kinase [Dyella lutea]|uniref:histidine kinase n=1 Tax=Dyella lutea TaxID=2950441 RepID=A0ABT1FED2_9GAMM|nr:HAMP domain-containing sensor histidine kinase [Dyella lutea]MCP1375739.1 HAMP domain-containing histidine kinase [Dyella lutea]
MNPLRSSLYRRLLVGFCLANLVVLFVGGSLAQRFIEYTTAVEIDWSALARDASHAYDTGGGRGLAEWSREQHREGIEATLFEDCRPLTPFRAGPIMLRDLPSWLAAGHDVLVQPRPGLYLAVQPVQGADGRTRQLVALSRTHTRLHQHTRQTILLAVQALLSLLLIGVIGWWIARSVARPVAALREATRRMAAGELSTRVHWKNGRGRDELAQLAGDFDAMAERIEALVAHDRGVLQDLSHELRSPLARLQLLLDFARRSEDPAEAAGYFARAEQEIQQLDRMTGEMLALSRLEGGLPGDQREPVDLAALARDGAARAQLEAAARGIALRLDAPSPVPVSCHALLLERALDNLLSNAIKFSPPGGEIVLGAHTAAGQARLSVRDHGPGVPPGELAALFRPFFRGSNAPRAEGSGLGLAIVKRVAHAHGGGVHAENAAGGGLEVSLLLPLAPAGD